MSSSPESLNSVQLRILWGVVDAHSELLRGLSDEAVRYWIFKKIQERLYLTGAETIALQRYLSVKTQLIRDMVESPCVKAAVS